MIRRDMEMEACQFYWLCGLMEGEGTFTRATPSMPRKPRLSIGMTDRDVIERVIQLTGTRLFIHHWPHDRYRTVYRTEVVGGSAVALMQLLRPYMSERRKTQIDEAVVTFQPLRRIRHKTYAVLPSEEESRDRYWLAGYLEGEGAFTHNRGAPMVEVNSVDHDVILRVQRIYAARYGVGVKIHTRPPRKVGYQLQYHLACYSDAARAIMADIVSLMGARRAARIDGLLGDALQLRLCEAPACYHNTGRRTFVVGFSPPQCGVRRRRTDALA